MSQQTPDKWKRTGQLLKKRATNHKRVAIDEMTLEQTLDAQKKYLVWAEKNKDHEDHSVKKHLYNNYLIPRIKYLKENPPKIEPPKKEPSYIKVETHEDNYALMGLEELEKIEKTHEDWLKANKVFIKKEEWKNRKKEYSKVYFWANKKRSALNRSLFN